MSNNGLSNNRINSAKNSKYYTNYCDSNNYRENNNFENNWSNIKLSDVIVVLRQKLKRLLSSSAILILALLSNSSQSIPFVFTKQKFYHITSPPQVRKYHLDSETRRELTQIIEEAEKYYGLPKNLLYSVAQTESSFTPWVIRFNHKIYRFSTLLEAKSFLSQFEHNYQKHNIDIGLMQINNQHARFFKNLTSMLDPKENIWFAAKLLAYNVTYAKSIKRAISIYNKGKYGALKTGSQCEYLKKVLANWFSYLGSIAMHVIDIDHYIDKVKKCYKIGNHTIIYSNHCTLFFNNKNDLSNSETSNNSKISNNSEVFNSRNNLQVENKTDNSNNESAKLKQYSRQYCGIYHKIIQKYLSKKEDIKNNPLKKESIKKHTVKKKSIDQKNKTHRQTVIIIPFVQE